MFGRFLQLFRAPGFVRPFDYEDPMTGEHVKVKTSPRYTILTVGCREYFFLRESGKFDGTGAMSVGDASPIGRYTAARIRKSGPSRAQRGLAPRRG